MKTDTKSYYAAATTWARSETDGARRSRNLAWIFAGAAVLVAIAEALALAGLAPLKSADVVPVLVDRQTGFVQVLDKDGAQVLRANAALTRSMLAQYVAAREGFDITTLSSDYHKVALWSGGQARSDYVSMMPAGNPQSPLRLYPRSTQVIVKIESISDLNPRTALVRFTTQRLDQSGAEGGPGYYSAIITYRFSDGPMRMEDRLINPLGFQVTRYRRSDEAAPAPGIAVDIPLAAATSSEDSVAPSVSEP